MNDHRLRLLDETTTPPLRSRLGSLLASATTASFAIRHIRLARIDLSAAELGPLHSCRVLVGRLDAATLHDLPPDRATSHHHDLHRLLLFSRSGRLAVRVAPTSGWNPDFSILQGPLLPPPHACCLLGSHYFREPDPPDGPAFTALFPDLDAATLALARFNALWDAGYDVLPAVTHALESMIPQ